MVFFSQEFDKRVCVCMCVCVCACMHVFTEFFWSGINPSLVRGQQQDVHEFYGFFMDQLSELSMAKYKHVFFLSYVLY